MPAHHHAVKETVEHNEPAHHKAPVQHKPVAHTIAHHPETRNEEKHHPVDHQHKKHHKKDPKEVFGYEEKDRKPFV